MTLKKLIRITALLTVLMILGLYPLTGAFTAHAATVSERESSASEKEANSVYVIATSRTVSSERLKSVTDADQYTYYYSRKEDRLSFITSQPVRGLYFVFEKPCRWTLTLPDGSVRQGGENEYLHEYFELDNEITSFKVDLPKGACLTDVYGLTEGTLPDWVQVWQPPCERADLMIMSTHADDEHLWFGGAMPYYAGELGYDVQVVYLTYHYEETYREHELLNGLWKVGVRHYPVITQKFYDEKETKQSMDMAIAYFGYDRVLAFQVEMLRRFSPRVVLGQDINGEYGHGAHKLNAHTLLEALQKYEDPSVFPESAEKYGIPKVQKCYLHLWEENQITVEWSDKILSHFGGKSALDMAIEGFSCHKSQQRWSFRVKDYGKYDCRLFGLVYTTVGNDTPGVNDMFEHVDWSDKIPVQIEEPEQVDVVSSDTSFSVGDSVILSRRKTGIKLLGKEFLWNDVVFAGMAVVLSLFAIIAVICLKRRR